MRSRCDGLHSAPTGTVLHGPPWSCGATRLPCPPQQQEWQWRRALDITAELALPSRGQANGLALNTGVIFRTKAQFYPGPGPGGRPQARAGASEANRPPQKEGESTELTPAREGEHRVRACRRENLGPRQDPVQSQRQQDTLRYANHLLEQILSATSEQATTHRNSQNARDLQSFHRKKHMTNEHRRNVKIVSVIHSPNCC